MNFEHRSCMAHSIKTDKFSRLHYIFNHASAERIRYLCKCHSFPGLQNLSVKQVEHIRDCEFSRLAKIHKKPSCKSVERHSVLGQMWYKGSYSDTFTQIWKQVCIWLLHHRQLHRIFWTILCTAIYSTVLCLSFLCYSVYGSTAQRTVYLHRQELSVIDGQFCR